LITTWQNAILVIKIDPQKGMMVTLLDGYIAAGD
jgi:hypothetical protein